MISERQNDKLSLLGLRHYECVRIDACSSEDHDLNLDRARSERDGLRRLKHRPLPKQAREGKSASEAKAGPGSGSKGKQVEMYLSGGRRDDLHVLVDEPTVWRSGNLGKLNPSRSRVCRKVSLDEPTGIGPREDDAVLAERDALHLDKRALKIVPAQRGDPLRAAPEWSTAIVAKLTIELLIDQ